MRLQTITEDDRTSRVHRQAKKLLSGLIGDLVTDPAAVYDHLIRGISNVNQFLMEDDDWWNELFGPLRPFDPQALEGFYEQTLRHVMELVRGHVKREFDLTEGLVSGFLGLLRKIAFFVIKAAIAGLVADSDGPEPEPPASVTGRRHARRREYIGYLNLVAATHFMGQVLDHAEEYRQGKASERNHQKGARDAAGNDPGREGTRRAVGTVSGLNPPQRPRGGRPLPEGPSSDEDGGR